MRAIRIHGYGGIDAMRLDEIPRPVPGAGEVLVAVKAAGVGPWDRLVREGRSGLGQALPLTLGSDVSGTVVALGAGLDAFVPGDAVYGATNDRFVGGYAEYALVAAGKVAPKPAALDYVTAAGLPVVAVTAYQMLFEYARIEPGQAILVRGAAGSVGACATQMAKEAGASVYGTARARMSNACGRWVPSPSWRAMALAGKRPPGPSMRSSTRSAATHSKAPARHCARTGSSSPSCARRTRRMYGRKACAPRISSSTSREIGSTGSRRWSRVEGSTCPSARFSTSPRRVSPTACWMARLTSPERSCSRSQTDRSASRGDPRVGDALGQTDPQCDPEDLCRRPAWAGPALQDEIDKDAQRRSSFLVRRRSYVAPALR